MPVWMRFPRFVFVLILCALLAFSSRADDVAAAPNADMMADQWTFWDGSSATLNSITGKLLAIGSGIVQSFAAGNAPSPDQAVNFTNWTTSLTPDANDYIEFPIATTKRSDIVVAFYYRATATGPSQLDFRYSTDNWITYASPFAGEVLNRNSEFNFLSYDLSAYNDINDISDLRIRLYGYNSGNASGSLRIDDITITELCQSPTPIPTKISGLTIVNTVNDAHPLVGANVIFTIKVDNPVGNISDATNVNVCASLPSGLTYISSAVNSGSYDAGTNVWSVDHISVGSSAELTLTAKVVSSLPDTFTATVKSYDYLDESASATFAPTPLSGAAALALSQNFSIRNDAPSRADITVSLTNNGGDAATNVQVRDLLPSGLSYIAHAQTRGSYNPTNGIWTINALANGETATLTLTVKVAASGTSTKNTAQIIASDQYDADASNDLFALEIPIADIGLTQHLDLTPTTAIFTVTATNAGPDAATLEIKSNLPSLASYAFISAGASLGTYDSVNGLWNLTLPSGTNATLTLTTNIVGALQSHIVEVVSSNAPDADSIPNNQIPAEDDMSGLPFADLSLTQTVSKVNPNVGEIIMLTIKIKNGGASGTNGVQVKSALPNGFAYSSSSATKGSYNPSNGVWTIGGLAKNETATLTLSAKVSFSGAFSVQSEIFASNFYDPDSTPNNAKDGEDDIAKTTLTTPSAARSVIINEVAWAGTASALSVDEWIELYNTTDSAINLNGWTLKAADGTPSIALNGVIPAHGFFLLEQGDDKVVSDIAADQIYSGSLSNSGETLYLRDGANALIDSANGNGGSWPAGSASTYGTMERRGVSAESDVVWHTNNGITKNGKNANGGEIWGTPKRANSASPLPTQTPYTGPTAIPTLPIPPRPIFNEILARPGFDWNQDGAINAFDEFIEIKNLTAIEISLKNWKITTLKGGTFILPDIKLAPNERRVFYGKETNLRLSDGGETLTLVSPQGKVYDTFVYSFARTENLSFCRLPDGSPTDKAWYEDCLPTPNLSNLREGKAPVAPALNACNLPDTIPFAFFLAECRAYGDGIWNPRYWQQAFARRVTDENSKWDSQIE